MGRISNWLTDHIEWFAKPWLVGIISIIASVSVYGIILLFADMDNVMQGLYLSLGIPAVVAPSVTLLIRAFVEQIEQQNRDLAELNATNKRLFSLLSHDLRSPIASLKSVMDLMLNEDLSAEEGKLMVKDLAEKTDRLLDFLNDILQWSLKQTELKPMGRSYFGVRESIESILQLFEDEREAKRIQLEVGGLDQSAYADKDSFAFVFRNVYHNALKFTPEGGKIQVFTEVHQGKLHTIVRDSGLGMDKSVVKAVLDPEQWYSSRGTKQELGTGFGISTAINYLKDNDGELQIDSEPGKGSIFRIILPQAV